MEPKIVKTKEELELCYMRLSERFMSIAKKYEEAKANADALRKENEELKEEIYFFARTFRYYAGEAFRFYEKHPLARETDETRAANTTKESEASHE